MEEKQEWLLNRIMESKDLSKQGAIALFDSAIITVNKIVNELGINEAHEAFNALICEIDWDDFIDLIF